MKAWNIEEVKRKIYVRGNIFVYLRGSLYHINENRLLDYRNIPILELSNEVANICVNNDQLFLMTIDDRLIKWSPEQGIIFEVTIIASSIDANIYLSCNLYHGKIYIVDDLGVHVIDPLNGDQIAYYLIDYVQGIHQYMLFSCYNSDKYGIIYNTRDIYKLDLETFEIKKSFFQKEQLERFLIGTTEGGLLHGHDREFTYLEYFNGVYRTDANVEDLVVRGNTCWYKLAEWVYEAKLYRV